jgi:hypothetical protein
MKNKMMMESNKFIGSATIPFPVFMLLTIGITHMVNPTSKSTKEPNTIKEPRWLFSGLRYGSSGPSLNSILNTNSIKMDIKGKASRKLVIVAYLGFAMIAFKTSQWE